MKYFAALILVAGIAVGSAAVWHYFHEPAEVTAYKQKARAFMAEVNSLIKLVEIEPSPKHEASRGTELISQWTRLPDPPAAFREVHQDMLKVPTVVFMIVRNYNAAIEVADLERLDDAQRGQRKADAKSRLESALAEAKGHVRELQKALE